MAPSTSGHPSSSLQIPTTDPGHGSSRHHQHSSSSAQSPPTASSASRPISVAAHTSSSQNQQSTSSRRQQRASHTVVSTSSNSQNQGNGNSQHDDSNPAITDVYNHPAAVAYAAAHPRRTIPRFGPYLLLQTLGEGEFGKVKLGLHCQWGEEVAVKLIRRGNVDSSVRMSKVEREIEVLKTLKHPNIVRLYDVIETDKYIGIILEYASGGELFDHILAHRYLRERDAAKLFSQLISGVWYIHQKKIVHRDLKLENLLLDRHRNVIITDFGFANRFEHRSDDLMQTSCGSPCYAAPELVISEGLYVGSAVDIWSCGVILYAMLAGYLPFDDDPANPDGDNINLLYKYIVSTPLSFPEYVSAEARDLLSMMLVPDPTRRTTLDGVMRHPWLAAYQTTRTDGIPNAFGKIVEELERAAMDQHHQKRIAYQRQMRANTSPNGAPNAVSPSRTQSHRPDYSTAPTSASRSRSTQPEYLYDSSVDQSTMSPTAGSVAATPTQSGAPRKAYGSPAALGLAEDDPFAGPGGLAVNSASNAVSPKADPASSSLSPNPSSKGKSSSNGNATSGGGFRHTIQVEYDDPSKSKRRERAGSQGQSNAPVPQELPPTQQPQAQSQLPVSPSVPPPAPPAGHTKERRGSQSSTKPLPPSPLPPTSYRAPTVTSPAPVATPAKANRPPELNGALLAEPLVVNVSSPPATPSATSTDQQTGDSGSQNSGSSTRKGHKKGKSSIDKLGLSKIFGSNSSSSPTNPAALPTASNDGSSTPTKQNGGSSTSVPLNVTPDGRGSSQTSVLLSPGGTEKESGGRKSRRNTLTVMVEPFRSTIRNRTKGKTANTPMTTEGGSAANGGNVKDTSPQIHSAVLPPSHATAPADAPVFIANNQDTSNANGLQASTNKARKVMQWFRTKSKGRDSIGFGTDEPEPAIEKTGTPTHSKYHKGYSASSSTINQQTPSTATAGLKESAMSPVPVVVTPSASARPRPALLNGGHPQRSASSTTSVSAVGSSFVNRVRNSVVVGGGSHHHDKSHPYGQLRIHHGAVDQTTITTRPPPEVMAHVRKVLEGMGVEIQQESEYKYRCIRGKKRKGTMSNISSAPSNSGSGSPGSLAAVTMVGSAASNGIDKRGLPLPSPSAFGTGGMLRGLLMRRQSSQVSSHGPASSQPSLAFDDETSVVVSEPMVMGAPGASVVEAAYGDPTQDAGDEVRFSVELTRLDRLNDTFSLDIRRLKGNLRSYKYLYDTLRDRADLAATQT